MQKKDQIFMDKRTILVIQEIHEHNSNTVTLGRSAGHRAVNRTQLNNAR